MQLRNKVSALIQHIRTTRHDGFTRCNILVAMNPEDEHDLPHGSYQIANFGVNVVRDENITKGYAMVAATGFFYQETDEETGQEHVVRRANIWTKEKATATAYRSNGKIEEIQNRLQLNVEDEELVIWIQDAD